MTLLLRRAVQILRLHQHLIQAMKVQSLMQMFTVAQILRMKMAESEDGHSPSSSDGEVAFEETKGFQLPADEAKDALPISIDEGKPSQTMLSEKSTKSPILLRRNHSTSSSSNDTDETSTSSGTVGNNVVDGAESSASEKSGADEHYNLQKPSIAPVEPDFEAMKLEDNTVSADRDNQNDHELHQDVTRSRRRSVSSSHDFDFDNYENHPRRRSSLIKC